MDQSYVAHLECARCQKKHEAGKVHNLCACGGPLLVRYDLERAARTLMRDQMASRPANLWRYREVLPVTQDTSMVCLGEGFTPLVHARQLGAKLRLPRLYLKDESFNPTGSFKARGLAVAVSMAKELGITRVAMPSAGNAGAAMAAYAVAAGMEAAVFVPEGTPEANVLECSLLGARLEIVPGSIKDCGRVMRERLAPWNSNGDGWFDVSTLREPYRLEGKKTMAYEVVEQLGGAVPDAMIYPTGGGTGLIGMWKAFEEMHRLGWIGQRRPRMIAVQSTGCAPMVRAFASQADRAEEWPNPDTLASGLRVPSAVGDFLILRAVRESRGVAVAVEDRAMLEAVREIAQAEGVLTSPEGGATLAALKRLLADGFLSGYETVVLFLTASAYKYLDALRSWAD